VFAAHDYTLISLLAASELIQEIKQPLEWGAYVIFELHDDPAGPFMRVLANFRPFNRSQGAGRAEETVCVDEEELLVEWSMTQLQQILTGVCSQLQADGRGLPEGFKVPQLMQEG
jgi:hypothetical protein